MDGIHLLGEWYGCPADKPEMLRAEPLRKACIEAVERAGLTIVGERFHQFQPQGVTGAVILAESHMAIHTWPEHGYAAVDLFYCGGTVKVHKAVDVLRERFKPERIKFLVVRRGLQGEVER